MKTSRELALSKSFVMSILSDNSTDKMTFEAMNDYLEIQAGDNKLLLEHLKAIANIMNKAIVELERDDNNE